MDRRPVILNYNKGEFIRGPPLSTPPPPPPQLAHGSANFSADHPPLLSSSPSPSSSVHTAESSSPQFDNARYRRVYSPKDFSLELDTTHPSTRMPQYSPSDFDLGISATSDPALKKHPRPLKLETNLNPGFTKDGKRDPQTAYSPSDFSLEVPTSSPQKQTRYSPEDFRLYNDEPAKVHGAESSEDSDEADLSDEQAQVGPASSSGGNPTGATTSARPFKGAGGRCLDSRTPSKTRPHTK